MAGVGVVVMLDVYYVYYAKYSAGFPRLGLGLLERAIIILKCVI